MTGIQSLEARAALGCIFATAGYVAATRAWLYRATPERFDRIVNVVFVASRLAIFAGVFFVLGLPVRGDIPAFYVPEARSVLQHLLPYRDFACDYAPLHPFLDAAVLRVWNSPLAIILFAILVECLILPVWMKIARLFAAESAVRIAAVLYVTSAISLQFVTIDGQDNVLIALLLGLGILATYRRRELISGGMVALGAVLVKFLPLLFVPAFLLGTRRWLRWAGGFAIVMIAGYGVFAWMRLPILYPVRVESGLRTASDLPYLLDSLAGITPSSRIEDGLLALTLLAAIAFMLRVRMSRPNWEPLISVMVFGSGLLNLTLLLFSKKSWPPYLELTLYPLCLLLGGGTRPRLRLACFAVFNVLAVTTHSIWATVFGQFLAPEFHQALLSREPMAIVFLMTQILLLTGYAWLLVECVQAIRRPDEWIATRASATS